MVKIRIDSTTPKVRERTLTDDFAERVQGMTHEQMVDAYRSTNDENWRNFLAWAIAQPRPGETPQQAQERAYGRAPSEIPKWASALGGFVNVSTYGLSDEMSGALDSLLGKRSYAQGLAKARSEMAQLKEANPKTYTTGQVAGAVPLAAQALLALPATGTAATGTAATMSGLAARGAAEGLAQGAAYGFGSGEGTSDRLWQALEQGLIGGTIGGLAPFAGRGIGAAYRYGRDAIKNRGAMNKGAQGILKMLQDNGITIGQARAAISRLGKDGMLADISPGMQVEAAGTAAKSPAATEVMSPRLAKRHDGMGGRVKGYLDEAMGPFQDPQTISDAVTATKKSAGPAFELAKTHIVDPEAAIEILRREMQTYGPNSDTGQALAKFYSQLVDGKGNVIGQGHIVHGVRQELDAALRGGTVKNTGPFTRVRNALDEALKTQIPGFAEADKTWSGAQKVQEAFDYGQREVMGSNVYPGQFQKTWGPMAAPEKTAARMGTRARLEMDTVSGAPNPGMRLERQLEKNMNDQKVGPMVEAYKPGGYKRLKDALDAETTFRETNDLVQATRGSRTAPVMMAGQNRWGGRQSMEGLSNALGQAATAGAAGGPGAAMMSLAVQGAGTGVKGIFDFLRRTNPDVIKAAGDLLTRQGPDAREALKTVIKLLRSNGVSQKQAQVIAKGLTGAVKSQAALGSATIHDASPIGGSRR